MNQRGFTFPEVIVSVAIFMVASGIGAAVLGPSISNVRADSQVTRVVGLIQLAREEAIKRQRDVEMRFVDGDDDTIRLVRVDDEGNEVRVAEVTFEYGMGFRQFADQGDTDAGFGADSPIEFDDAQRMLFISDGSLVDEDSIPINGSIFLGMANKPDTSRAVTVTGTTARPRVFRWMGLDWSER